MQFNFDVLIESHSVTTLPQTGLFREKYLVSFSGSVIFCIRMYLKTYDYCYVFYYHPIDSNAAYS